MTKKFLTSPFLKVKFYEMNYASITRYQIHLTSISLDKTISSFTPSKFYPFLNKFEHILGLMEVKIAQNNVLEAEKRFLKVQLDRRNAQFKMTEIQTKLKDIHNRLDKLTRGDERYLALLTEEYEIMQDEKRLSQEIQLMEQSEHDEFSALSSSVRESHEKERTRAEKTKYWSIVGSLIGAGIGIIGTSLNNHYRMKELKSLMGIGIQTNDQLKFTVDKLANASTLQLQQLSSFINYLKDFVNGDENKINDLIKITSLSQKKEMLDDNEVFNSLSEQDNLLRDDFEQLKKMVTKSSSLNNIIYVGPEFSHMLNKMEENLEWKIKKNAFLNMTIFYGGVVAMMLFLFLKTS